MIDYNLDIQKKLKALANQLVPETFRYESPQFYDFIVAFLENIQEVQEQINVNFINDINTEDIKYNDVLKLYFDTYLATMGLEEDTEFTKVKDLLKVSKDLSYLKGTPFIYGILINFLIYLVPTIKNEYLDLLALAENETDEIYKQKLLDDAGVLREEGFTSSFVNVNEIDVFHYSIEADFKEELFDKYVKPFAHPAGWQVDFLQIVFRFIREDIENKEEFTIAQTFRLPGVIADGYIPANNTSDEYPLLPLYDTYALGSESSLTEFQSQMINPQNLYVEAGNVFYDFVKITVSKYHQNRPIENKSTDNMIWSNIRYSETAWEFPHEFYNVSMTYFTNIDGAYGNGSLFSNMDNKHINYRTIIQNDISV